jgi:hypothetical protein
MRFREAMEQPTLSFSACMGTETKKPLTIMILPHEGTDPNAVRSMQHFISGGVWHDKDILKRHCQEVDKYLGDEDGVQILDGSDFPKQKGTPWPPPVS